MSGAGLKVKVADIDPDTLDYDYKKLGQMDCSRVLCIVTSNLYGIPNNTKRLSEVAESRGVFLVDDAAQCMGGTVDDQHSGTFGVAGIFSLDKGKNITSIDGGIIITDSEDLAEGLEREKKDLEELPLTSRAGNIGKMIAYAVLLHPRWYWIPKSMPFLNLGQTVFSTDFPIASYGASQAAMANVLFAGKDLIAAQRVHNYFSLLEALAGAPGMRHVVIGDRIRPVSLRFPVMIEDGSIREHIVRDLNALGIGASKSYPRAISDIPQLAGLLAVGSAEPEMGRKVAREIVTLPTHPYVESRDIGTVKKVFLKHLEGCS